MSPRVFGSEENKGLYIIFQLSLPIFGYIIYTMLLFLDMLKNVLVDKEVHWPIYRGFIGT